MSYALLFTSIAMSGVIEGMFSKGLFDIHGMDYCRPCA